MENFYFYQDKSFDFFQSPSFFTFAERALIITCSYRFYEYLMACKQLIHLLQNAW